MQKDFIEFLKERAPIVDIVSKYVKLTKKGKDWFGRCPFHSEKTGSFKVDIDKGLYYCFGCGARGDIINFTMEMEKLSFLEAVKHIANICGVRVPADEQKRDSPESNAKSKMYEVMEIAKSYFEQELQSNAARKAREYLSERGVSDEAIAKFQLGFASDERKLIARLKNSGFSEEILIKTGLFFKNPRGGELVDKFSGRITFPIIDFKERCVGFGGRIVEKIDAAKYINSPETEIFVKSQQLYGYHLAKKSKSHEIILVEGYLDVIAMHTAGFDAAVAPLGTAISDTQINMCWKICDNPVICLDGDNAGLKASFRWIDKILPMLTAGKSFKFARLPQDSDPDSLILNGERDIISEAVKNALPLSEWMWKGAFLLYPSQTPEQKAAIIKMLMEKTKLISDRSLQKLYARFLKQKENDLYYYKRRNWAVSEVKKSATPVKEKIEQILVVTIINHPYIIDEVVEDFAKLEFNVPLMRKLKDEILRAYGAYYVEEKNEKAGEEAISELRKAILDIEKNVKIYTKITGRNITEKKTIISEWSLFLKKYLSIPTMIEDLHNASVRLQSNFSEDNWRKLKALKNNLLLANKNEEKQ